MKILKVFALVVVALLALVALGLVLALTPAVQTWAVKKALAGRPGIEVARIAAGLSQANLEGVRIDQNGMVITAKQVAARYSAMDFLTHRRITIDDVSVEDLLIDARGTATAAGNSAPANPAPSPAPKEPTAGAPSSGPAQPSFNGLLNQAQLPYDLRIAKFFVPGRALLPGDQSVAFEIRGSDLATGHQGTVDWKTDLTNPAPQAPYHVVHSTGSATVHITTERRIDVANVSMLVAVEGPKLPSDQLKLDLKAEQPAAGGNEGYNATLSLVRGMNLQPLVNLVGQYNATSREISGAWTTTIQSDQLRALLNGLGLPEIAADGAGKFSVKPDTGAVAADGELRTDVAHLETISPDLTQIGALHLQTRFAGGFAHQVAQLEHFALDATTADGRQLAQISALQKIGFNVANKHVTFDNPQSDLAHVSLRSLPLAWAQPFAKGLTIQSGDLSLQLAVAAAADGSRVRITPVEPLVLRNATVRNATQVLCDGLNLAVKPQAEYAPDHLHAELNDLTATLASGDTFGGRITADVTQLTKTPRIAFTTDTQAKFVAALKPYVKADTGPLSITTRSSGVQDGNTLHFASSSTRITRPDGSLVAALELEQPLTFDLQTNAITAAQPDREALRVQLGRIPLAWAEGYVAGARFAGGVTGGTLGVTVRSLNQLAATTTQPLTLQGVSVTMNQQPMLQNVDLTVDAGGSRQGDAVHYDVRRIEAKSGGATLLTLAVAGDTTLAAKPALSARGTVQGDLGALAQQPALASSASLARGTLDGNFDVKLTATVEAKAMLNARGLVARQNNQPLGDALLELTAAVQPDGSSVLRVPFTLTNGSRKSDLLVDGKLARSGNALTFNGRISSSQLIIDDLKPLAALAPASKPAANGTASTRPAVPAVSGTGAPSTPTPANTPSGAATAGAARTGPNGTPVATTAERDTVPFWNGFGGKVDLDLKAIDYGTEYRIRGVQGSAVITPSQLALESLQGQFKDQPFKVSAKVDFDAKQPKPYTLAAAANVEGFDVGAFLRATNPNQPPQVETKVTVDMKLNGQGTTLMNLAQNAYGVFDVQGSKGVLRALSGVSGTLARGGGLAAGLLGSGMLGNKQSDTATAVGELINKLVELPFDRVTMHVERGADLAVKIGNLEFISADMRLSGKGGLANQPGVPVQDQPMQIVFQLAGKDAFGYLLQRAKLLSGQQDDQGYYLMTRTFTLKGKPTQPDASDLKSILAQTALGAATDVLQHFLGK